MITVFTGAFSGFATFAAFVPFRALRFLRRLVRPFGGQRADDARHQRQSHFRAVLLDQLVQLLRKLLAGTFFITAMPFSLSVLYYCCSRGVRQ